MRILTFFTIAFLTASAVLAGAQTPAASATGSSCPEASSNNAFLGIATVRLWPGDAPEAKGEGCEDIPTLSVLRPQPGHENGSAVIVMPGGAYLGLAAILEGREVGDWFASRGFTSFVLRYRLGKKYLMPVPKSQFQAIPWAVMHPTQAWRVFTPIEGP